MSLSDDERDIDVESDDADKRAHHNALERKRRDHIKDSFSGLRDSVPSLQGEKSSRAQILNKATDYIQFMRRKNHTHQADIDELKRQNMILDQQVRQLEKARATGNMAINASATAVLSSDPSLLAVPPPTEVIIDNGKQSPSDVNVMMSNSDTSTHQTNGLADDCGVAAKRVKTES